MAAWSPPSRASDAASRHAKVNRSSSISSEARNGCGMDSVELTPIEIGLTAAIVATEAEEPSILVAADRGQEAARAGLPFGPFDPLAHRTFEIGLRAWVEAQTGLRVGYVEQLYTFGDRGRHAEADAGRPHGVSVGYLALTRIP